MYKPHATFKQSPETALDLQFLVIKSQKVSSRPPHVPDTETEAQRRAGQAAGPLHLNSLEDSEAFTEPLQCATRCATVHVHPLT